MPTTEVTCNAFDELGKRSVRSRVVMIIIKPFSFLHHSEKRREREREREEIMNSELRERRKRRGVIEELDNWRVERKE